MSWSKEKSQERISERDFKASEVTITKLSRERDFENIGTKEAVEATGIHSYARLGGFQDAVLGAREDEYKQKKALRALTVFHKMADYLVSLHSNSSILQFQSERVHNLTFKPYDNADDRALNAVVAAIDFVSYIPLFNKVFKEELGQTFTGEVGLAEGRTFIVNIGKKGNRELLSLGGPASRGAKNLHGSNEITVCENIYKALPIYLRDLFKEKTRFGKKVYSASSLTWDNLSEKKKNLSPEFREDDLIKKTNEFKDAINLDDINISSANEKIDFDKVSDCTVKRMDSLSIYADLDGFTNHMDGLTEAADIKEAVRLFHGIRAELEEVLSCDFPKGLKVQQRGDCLLGNVHLPTDDETRTESAVDTAVALMSSMEVLNDHFNLKNRLDLQVGVATGKVFFARVGKHGERTPATVGQSADLAEALQQQCAKKEIRLCKKTFSRIPVGLLKDQFKENESDGSYTAKNLTVDKMIDLEDRSLSKAAHSKTALSEVASAGVFRIGTAQNTESHRHVNTAPHLTTRKL